MNYKTPTVSEDKAREILLNYLNRKRSFSKLSSNDIKIRSMNSNDSIFYVLQTYRVSQKFEEKFTAKLQPFEKIKFEDEMSSIDFTLKNDTFYEEKSIIIPDTEVVKLCHSCYGSKYIKCKKCQGSGEEMCMHCYGASDTQCYHCNNRGSLNCESCLSGKISCYTCEGYGSVKWYKELLIKKDTIVDDYLKSNETSIPARVLKKSKGEIIVQEHNKKIKPISHFPDVDINNKSKELIMKHQMYKKFDSNSEVISQFHQLCAIPVTTCIASYNNKSLLFYIIGKENFLYISKDHSNSCIII